MQYRLYGSGSAVSLNVYRVDVYVTNGARALRIGPVKELSGVGKWEPTIDQSLEICCLKVLSL